MQQYYNSHLTLSWFWKCYKVQYTGHLSAVQKWGGKTSDYAKSVCVRGGGQDQKSMASISDFGQNLAKASPAPRG